MKSLIHLNILNSENFLKITKLLLPLLVFVIGNNILRLIDSFFDDIILVCNTEKNKEQDVNCLTIIDSIYYYKITLHNYNIYIGRFTFAVIRFIISCLIAFYIARLFKDIID